MSIGSEIGYGTIDIVVFLFLAVLVVIFFVAATERIRTKDALRIVKAGAFPPWTVDPLSATLATLSGELGIVYESSIRELPYKVKYYSLLERVSGSHRPNADMLVILSVPAATCPGRMLHRYDETRRAVVCLRSRECVYERVQQYTRLELSHEGLLVLLRSSLPVPSLSCSSQTQLPSYGPNEVGRNICER